MLSVASIYPAGLHPWKQRYAASFCSIMLLPINCVVQQSNVYSRLLFFYSIGSTLFRFHYVIQLLLHIFRLGDDGRRHPRTGPSHLGEQRRNRRCVGSAGELSTRLQGCKLPFAKRSRRSGFWQFGAQYDYALLQRSSHNKLYFHTRIVSQKNYKLPKTLLANDQIITALYI